MTHLHEYFRYDEDLPHPDLWPAKTQKVKTTSWGPWSVVLGDLCEGWVVFCDGETVPCGTTVKLDPRKPFVVKHGRREVPTLFASKKRKFSDGMPKRLTKEAFGKGVGARQMALTDYGHILDIDGDLYKWTPYIDLDDVSIVHIWDTESAGHDAFDVPRGLITDFLLTDKYVSLRIEGGYTIYGELHPTPRTKESTMVKTPLPQYHRLLKTSEVQALTGPHKTVPEKRSGVWGPWRILYTEPDTGRVWFCHYLDEDGPIELRRDTPGWAETRAGRIKVQVVEPVPGGFFTQPRPLTASAFDGVQPSQIAVDANTRLIRVGGRDFRWEPLLPDGDPNLNGPTAVCKGLGVPPGALPTIDVAFGQVDSFEVFDGFVALTLNTPRADAVLCGAFGDTKAPVAETAEQITFFRPAGEDAVKSPSHYTYIKDTLGVEVVDILTAAFQNDPLKWNAGKYLFRAEHKGKEAEDLRKAKQYIDFRLAQLENGGRIK